jgi:hypothetical protein
MIRRGRQDIFMEHGANYTAYLYGFLVNSPFLKRPIDLSDNIYNELDISFIFTERVTKEIRNRIVATHLDGILFCRHSQFDYTWNHFIAELSYLSTRW